MSRRNKTKPKAALAVARASGRRRWTVGLAALGVAVLAAAGGWWSLGRRTDGSERSAATVVQAAVAATPDFAKLKGRWVRPDGGYVVEIHGVDGSGNLDAVYLNPNPIHVAKAQASSSGMETRVFIELRDVNYPGSTYTLTYDPAADQLKGSYYQAVEQETYEIYFERMK